MFRNLNKAIDLRYLEVSHHKTADNGWMHTEQQHTSALGWGVLNLLETAWRTGKRSHRFCQYELRCPSHVSLEKKNPSTKWRSPEAKQSWLETRNKCPSRKKSSSHEWTSTLKEIYWKSRFNSFRSTAKVRLKKTFHPFTSCCIFLLKISFDTMEPMCIRSKTKGPNYVLWKHFSSGRAVKTLPISSHILLIVAMKG